ncbi:MAG: SDR family NAD(P)-dependent oxidoreductase [Flavobacteriaceae bacterium]|nr:SDR family NAD(P)-dependent oxidoreductase [Flavobacteriaceae bacterium]
MGMSKLILITGGSSGIGKAAAKHLVNEGHKVIIQARNKEKLVKAANEIDPTGKSISYYSTDLSDLISVKSSAIEIVNEHGVPDVIINSAGAGEWLSFKEATAEHFIDTINSPYLATAYTCKVFFDKMQKRNDGHFIIVNSVASYVPIPGAVGYSSARSAMLGLAKSLQADLHDSNFDVSIISLGKVASPYFSNNPISEERIPKAVSWLVPTMSESEAGIAVASIVYSKQQTVIKPNMMNFLIFLNRFMPRVFQWLMRRTGYKSES